MTTCRNCNGSFIVDSEHELEGATYVVYDPCPDCNGTGEVEDDK